jgi:hypothetical protein
VSPASPGAAGAPSADSATVDATTLKWFRRVLLFLVFFDLSIAIPALLFPLWPITLAKLNADVPGAVYRSGLVEPLFLRGVGVLWLLAAWVQYLAWRDPVGRLSAVNIAIVFRFCGGSFELFEALVLLPRVGFHEPLIFYVLAVFVAGDYALVAAMVWMLRKMGLPWWQLPAKNAG